MEGARSHVLEESERMWLVFIFLGSVSSWNSGAGARRHLYPTFWAESVGPSVFDVVQRKTHGSGILVS